LEANYALLTQNSYYAFKNLEPFKQAHNKSGKTLAFFHANINYKETESSVRLQKGRKKYEKNNLCTYEYVYLSTAANSFCKRITKRPSYSFEAADKPLRKPANKGFACVS
jgi:heme oxygenase